MIRKIEGMLQEWKENPKRIFSVPLYAAFCVGSM